MNRVLESAKFLGRAVLLALFCFFTLGWVVFAAYCIQRYLSGGFPAVGGWILHVVKPLDPSRFFWSQPNWLEIVARLLGEAAVTFLLWVVNRKLLRRLMTGTRAYFREILTPEPKQPVANG